MEKYISGIRKHKEAISLRLRTGVSRSFSASSWACAEGTLLCPAAGLLFLEAPYPASSTAAITASGLALPSTPMELVRRLTEQEVTPGTLETAFSTRALQADQLMPVT